MGRTGGYASLRPDGSIFLMSVRLAEHDPAWATAFADEAQGIRAALGEPVVQLHHIGSTAVRGMLAKPIIDMLGVVDCLDAMDRYNPAMQALGYEVMGTFGIEGRRYFRKFDESGRRTHHLHMFERGCTHIERHLAFRDFLRNHPQEVAQYSMLKAGIVAGGHTSWDDYGAAKDAYVEQAERRALDWYRRQGVQQDG